MGAKVGHHIVIIEDLESFHISSLQRILKLSWCHRVADTEIRHRTSSKPLELILIQRQLRWIKHDGDADARRLNKLFESFNMTQHVNAPTHRCGHTLDVVLTFADHQLDDVRCDPAGLFSYHSLIICHIPVVVDMAPSATRLVRRWRRVNREKLGQALNDSALCQSVTTSGTDINELFSAYDNVLRDIADRFPPVQNCATLT